MAKTHENSSMEQKVNLKYLLEVESRVRNTIERVQSAMLAPDSIKSAPTFSFPQLSTFSGVDKSSFYRRIGSEKNELPNGVTEGTSRRRFSVADVAMWSKAYRTEKQRPQGKPAAVISIVNFKGGVSKSSTAITLSQGLSLRGHKCLIIDLDAQGSITSLFGMSPDTGNTDLIEDTSMLPLFMGTEQTVDYAIKNTYWPGIDIITANLSLYAAEFALPSRQKEDPSFEFWHVLKNGLVNAIEKYDVIIIDTPPSLSYTTVNALLASDGLIMPLPPNQLDFLSSGQFWALLNELFNGLVTERGGQKNFAFVDVLLSKVDSNDPAVSTVRKWIAAAYAELVLAVEIPKTTVTSMASAEFCTVYDLDVSKINNRTYRRAFDAYDRMVELVEEQIVEFWGLR